MQSLFSLCLPIKQRDLDINKYAQNFFHNKIKGKNPHIDPEAAICHETGVDNDKYMYCVFLRNP